MLVWDSSYSVRVKEIDDQHRRMIDYINELESLPDDAGKESMVHVMQGLIAYTVDHFATEEAYFSLFEYEKTREHLAQHKQLLEDVKSFVMKFDSDPEFDKNALLGFLRNWLINHIMGADKQYVRCFTDNGLA